MVGRLIRPAERRDLDALLRIEDAAFPTDRLTRRDFAHALRSVTIDMGVAEENGVVTGYFQVHRRRGSTLGRLATIAVDPGAAGSGIGRALMEAAEQVAVDGGCDRLRLEVRADNGRAIGIYARAGYRSIGQEPDYYEDGCAAERFEKVLT